MYIIKVYEEDEGGYQLVGRVEGRFLTYQDARIAIENQDKWRKVNFYFRIEEVNQEI